jgi:hypothetical protein
VPRGRQEPRKIDKKLTLVSYRRHPAVMNQANKVFVFIAQALEAETLQGQTASRVVAATKALLTAARVDPKPLLEQFSPESQRTIMGYFA